MVLLKRERKNKIPNINTGTRFLMFVFFLAVIDSCSPHATNKTLRFFFDGVPVIDTLVTEQITDTANAVSDSLVANRPDPHKTTKFYHAPYREKQCGLCHDQQQMGKLTESQPALCYQCHEDFGDVYKFVHGPVAGGYCTSCHNPHFASDSTLLVRTGQDLCLYCHKPGKGYNEEIHDGIEDTACTECHNPHGADSRELLY